MNNTLTPAMKRCLDDIIAWGEIGPDTEKATGCYGSAFSQVIGGLRARGLLDGKELPTEAAHALYCKTDDEIPAVRRLRKKGYGLYNMRTVSVTQDAEDLKR